MIIQPQIYFLDYIYGPRNIDHNFYETVTRAYEDICIAKGTTPHIEEVEEWIFRGVINNITITNKVTHCRDNRYDNDEEYRRDIDDIAVRGFVNEYSGVVSEDIKICLDHANVSYIGYEDTLYGSEECIFNSAQVNLLDISAVEGELYHAYNN